MKKLLLGILILPVVLRGQIMSTYAGGGINQADSISALNAPLGFFGGIAIDTSGDLYIAVANGNKIRRVDKITGLIYTVAGTGVAGFSGDNGQALLAELKNPIEIAFDKNNNLYIDDGDNNRIRKVNAITGIITTVAGGGLSLGDGGLATAATLNGPQGITVDTAGNIYISDVGNARIRRVDVNGIISTVAGNGNQGFSGDGALAINAQISSPIGLCTDVAGNLFIDDWNNRRIRKIDMTTGIISTIAGIGTGTYNGDNILATSAYIDPFGMTFDDSGNLFIADRGDNRIRKIDVNGIIHTVAGTGVAGYSGDGGTPDTATMNHPQNVVFDLCKNMFIADDFNRRVRKIAYDSTCSYSNPVDTTDTTTVIKYLPAQSKIEIYPNPAKEQLTVAGGSNTKDVMIVNAIGQVVVQQKSSNYKTVLNVSGLKEGVYIIAVRDEKSGKATRMKFVKE